MNTKLSWFGIRIKNRVKTNTVLQYEQVECGAASLKIILKYYGKVMSLTDLRERCGISRDGVTALQLKKAALELGLEVKGLSCSAEHLRKNGNNPCILFWNFNHFLVLEGFTNGRAYLSDPASGRRSIDLKEFQNSFTGVALELRPGQDFHLGGREPKLYHRLPVLFKTYRNLLPLVALISLVGTLPELFMAGATSQFVGGFLQDGRLNLPIPIIWILGISVMLLIALLNLQQLLLRTLSNQLLKRISAILYISLFSLPYSYFVRRMSGELSTRLTLPFTLVQLGVTGLLNFFLSTISGLLALIVGMLISPWLALLTLAITGVSSALTTWIKELRKDDNYKLAMLKGKSEGIGIYAIQSIESIKASGLENEAFMQWAASFNESMIEVQKQSLANSLVGIIGTTSGFLIRSCILLLGSVLIIFGKITLGELVAFQFLTGLISQPLAQLGMLSSQLQSFDGEMGRTNDLIDNDVDPAVRSFKVEATPASNQKLRGELELREIGFQFSKNSPMLFGGLSFNLQAGQHLAIVGSSGSGKSTLLRLLAGLHPPTKGEILYDGRNWLEWEDPTLRASIALVAQDVFLFSTTLEQNLTLWDPSFNSEEAKYALEQAGLLDELGGATALNQFMGNGSGKLSGGQRQRVEIARALIRRPSLLLMDEATSALDDSREKQIITSVKKVPRTLLTVAHRMYAATVSDWVLVLEQGQLIEQGHPCDLAEAEGPYQRLLETELLQSSNRGRSA